MKIKPYIPWPKLSKLKIGDKITYLYDNNIQCTFIDICRKSCTIFTNEFWWRYVSHFKIINNN